MPSRIALATLALALALTPIPAEAKRLGGMKVCGSSGCENVSGAQAQHFHDTGGMDATPMAADPRPAPFYRIQYRILDELGHEAGRFTNIYVPSARALHPVEDPGGWMRASHQSAAALAALIGGARPFPAARLPASIRAGSGGQPTGGAKHLPAYSPAADRGDGDDDLALGWILAGPAGIGAVLLAGAYEVRRRRRRAG